MKHPNINIAVVEEHHFYNQVIQDQISQLCTNKEKKKLHFNVTSISQIKNLLNDAHTGYQAIIFDNYFNNNSRKAHYNVNEVMETLKQNNKDCFFISLSGYREMNISAYLYKDGELQFTYSKQSAVKNENHEEACSIPAIHKLMERLINTVVSERKNEGHAIAA